jgi:hypothetical protein
MRKKNFLIVITLVLAAAQFARCYVSMNLNYLDLTKYAHGLERMPFQGRMLMMYPLRWAEQSRPLARITAGREGALKSPELALLTLIAFVCICLTGLLLTSLYMKTSRQRRLLWLPAAFFMLVCTVQYIVHIQNVLYPYDMLSLFFFTLGLYLIFTGHIWWLVFLFPVATLNREVSLFLILLLALDRWAAEGWPGLRRPRFISQVVALSAIWVAIHLYVLHRFAMNPIEPGGHMQKNIRLFLIPQVWPQLAALGAFLIPILFVYRRRILNPRFRAYLWVILPWLVCMFFYGELVETRVLGELSGLIALAAVLELEETASPSPSAPA